MAETSNEISRASVAFRSGVVGVDDVEGVEDGLLQGRALLRLARRDEELGEVAPRDDRVGVRGAQQGEAGPHRGIVVRARLDKESFDVVARIASEHNASKQQGGDAGWHRRRADRLPEPLLAAAFAQAAGAVSAPVRLPDGVVLVKTLDVEPDPDDATLRQRLREGKAKELQQQLFDACKLTMAKAAATPVEGRK
jgi:hypothetical protein